MSDDLVERLRAMTHESDGPHGIFEVLRNSDGPAAADRIEAQEAEIRSLRAQVAQERAGIVRWLRAQVTCGCGRDDCIADNYPLAYADAIEAQQDKEPQT